MEKTFLIIAASVLSLALIWQAVPGIGAIQIGMDKPQETKQIVQQEAAVSDTPEPAKEAFSIEPAVPEEFITETASEEPEEEKKGLDFRMYALASVPKQDKGSVAADSISGMKIRFDYDFAKHLGAVADSDIYITTYGSETYSETRNLLKLKLYAGDGIMNFFGSIGGGVDIIQGSGMQFLPMAAADAGFDFVVGGRFGVTVGYEYSLAFSGPDLIKTGAVVFGVNLGGSAAQ